MPYPWINVQAIHGDPQITVSSPKVANRDCEDADFDSGGGGDGGGEFLICAVVSNIAVPCFCQ